MSSKIAACGAALAVLAAIFGLSASTVTAQSAVEMPNVGLPDNLMTAASAFERYTRGAAAISGGFSSGPSVAKALAAGAAYEPRQFETGMIAFAALAAMQDEQFVAGVRAAGGEQGYGRGLASELVANPYAVLRLDGAEGASVVAANALAARGAPLSAAGRSVKQSAYDVQRSAWSKATIVQPAERLARIKALSAQPLTADPADVTRLLKASTGYRAGVQSAAPTPVVVRALALAAEAILGEAAGADPERLAVLTEDPAQRTCLRMAKLNLYQCLAVAGPHYEDIFCLGQHAMIDTGQCVSKAAGAAGSVSVQRAIN